MLTLHSAFFRTHDIFVLKSSLAIDQMFLSLQYTGNISNTMKSLSLGKSRSMAMNSPENGWARHDDEKRSTTVGQRKSKGERLVKTSFHLG